MTTATRILKADPRRVASRVRLTDLSEPMVSSFDNSTFKPLLLPTEQPQRQALHTDSRLNSAVAALQVAADKLHAQRDHWLDQSQQEAVHLGVAIAERLLRRTLDAQPEAILDLIRSAFDWSAGAAPLRVRLHPADAELATSAAQLCDANREMEFHPDDSLVRGDCLVETPNGQTDARLHVILQRIANELLAE